MTSCGSGNAVVSNGLIQKRKYQKGFFIKNLSFKRDAGRTVSAQTIYEDSIVLISEKNNSEVTIADVTPVLKDDSVSSVKQEQSALLGSRLKKEEKGSVSRKQKRLPFKMLSKSITFMQAKIPFPYPSLRIDTPPSNGGAITALTILFSLMIGIAVLVIYYTDQWLLAAMLVLLGILAPILTIVSFVLMIFRGIESPFQLWGTIIATLMWISFTLLLIFIVL